MYLEWAGGTIYALIAPDGRIRYFSYELRVYSIIMTETEGKPTLFGASHHLVMTSGALYPLTRAEYDSDIAGVHAQLGDPAFEATWANGRAMSLDQATAYTLINDD